MNACPSTGWPPLSTHSLRCLLFPGNQKTGCRLPCCPLYTSPHVLSAGHSHGAHRHVSPPRRTAADAEPRTSGSSTLGPRTSSGVSSTSATCCCWCVQHATRHLLQFRRGADQGEHFPGVPTGQPVKLLPCPIALAIFSLPVSPFLRPVFPTLHPRKSQVLPAPEQSFRNPPELEGACSSCCPHRSGDPRPCHAQVIWHRPASISPSSSPALAPRQPARGRQAHVQEHPGGLPSGSSKSCACYRCSPTSAVRVWLPCSGSPGLAPPALRWRTATEHHPTLL